MVRIEVTRDTDGMKLTECIRHAFPELSKPAKLLRAGDIRLNGRRTKKDLAVSEGDIIELYTPLALEQRIPLSIVYEDKNLLVINKEPGVAVYAPQTGEDLMAKVIDYMQERGEYVEELGYIPFPCFKLDVNTGGLVIYAKNGDFFEAMRTAIRQRQVKRHFQAIIKGCPQYDKGELQHFYLKEGEDKYRVTSKKIANAVPIYTKYDVLRTNGKFSLVEVEPVTQYLNQERAHLHAAGYPILGDAIYGDARLNKKMGIRHQALWATKIVFQTGTGTMLGYLNGMTLETKDIGFPIVQLDEDEE